MHFDLTDLRLFLHVVEAGSITAGVSRAGLALASASTRVRGMEEQAISRPDCERKRPGHLGQASCQSTSSAIVKKASS